MSWASNPIKFAMGTCFALMRSKKDARDGFSGALMAYRLRCSNRSEGTSVPRGTKVAMVRSRAFLLARPILIYEVALQANPSFAGCPLPQTTTPQLGG